LEKVCAVEQNIVGVEIGAKQSDGVSDRMVEILW
jgi:hypothetical protein